MTVVNSWMNADGLYIKYGASAGASSPGGEINVEGLVRVITIGLDLTTLTTSPLIISDVCDLDKNIRVERVDIDVITAAATSTSATLNVGLISDDRATVYPGTTPAQALLAAMTAATMVQGVVSAQGVGSTYVGTQTGQTLPKNGLITASTGVGTFTAGFVMVRIYFTVPNV